MDRKAVYTVSLHKKDDDSQQCLKDLRCWKILISRVMESIERGVGVE